MTATKNHAATSRPRHGGRDAQGATATATPKGATATTGTTSKARRGHDMHGHDRIQRNVPARYHTTRQNTIVQTYQRCTMQQTPPVGECPPGAKSKAAGSLVLTLNARWNIFGLPVTHEGFTYLVAATVVAPYILCIMFLGLMLMAVKLA